MGAIQNQINQTLGQASIAAGVGKHAIAEAKQAEIAEAKNQAKAEAQQIIDNAREQIAKEKAQAIAEIRSEVAALSIGMAEKILRKELENKKVEVQNIGGSKDAKNCITKCMQDFTNKFNI